MKYLKSGLLKCKLSFDFDGTLEHKPIQRYAKELIEQGHEVWITTTRFGDDEKYKRFFHTSTNVDLTNNDLWEIAEEIGISKDRIHFTDMNDKWRFIKTKDFLWHIDDDCVENRQILKNTKTLAISSLGNANWENKCDRIIRNAQGDELRKYLQEEFKKGAN